MKAAAERLANRMSFADKTDWLERNLVVAFSKPLKVVEVEYFDWSR